MTLTTLDIERLNYFYKKAEENIITLNDVEEIIAIFEDKKLLTKERFNETVFHYNGYADASSFFQIYNKKRNSDSGIHLNLKIPGVLGAIKGVITGIQVRSAKDNEWLELKTSLKKELKEELTKEFNEELRNYKRL